MTSRGTGRGRRAASPHRRSGARATVAPAPGGWTPWLTIGSWFGSPIRTSDRAQEPTATALASDIWLASSTNRTSNAPSNSGRANSHAVPATTSTVPASRACRTSALSSTRVTPSRWPTWASSSSAFWSARTRTCASRRRFHHGLEQVADGLVRLRGDRDHLPLADEVEDHPRPGVGLARARRALDRQRSVVELRGQGGALRRGRPRRVRRAARPSRVRRGGRRSSRSRTAR